MARTNKPISKKRKFVKDGVFFSELNEFLQRELAEDGYTGCRVRVTPHKTEIIINALKSNQVVGKNGKRIRELTALVEKRFKFPANSVKCISGLLHEKSLSALAQAEAVKYRLLEGLSVRRACYAVLKLIKDKGAKGCEVVVSGKLRGQRAKSMKFREGYMIHAGDAANYFIDSAVKHVHLRQGVLGIKVKIMLPYDPDGKFGCKKDMPDKVTIREPQKYEADEHLERQRREEELKKVREQEEAERAKQQEPFSGIQYDEAPVEYDAGGAFEQAYQAPMAGGPPAQPQYQYQAAPQVPQYDYPAAPAQPPAAGGYGHGQYHQDQYPQQYQPPQGGGGYGYDHQYQ